MTRERQSIVGHPTFLAATRGLIHGQLGCEPPMDSRRPRRPHECHLSGHRRGTTQRPQAAQSISPPGLLFMRIRPSGNPGGGDLTALGRRLAQDEVDEEDRGLPRVRKEAGLVGARVGIHAR